MDVVKLLQRARDANDAREAYRLIGPHAGAASFRARAVVRAKIDAMLADVEPGDLIELLQAYADIAALRAFAAEMMGDWPDNGDVDGFELQEAAIRCGLLARVTPDPTEPCGENCGCAEVNGPEDWACGVICYRPTDALRRARGD